MSRIKILSGDIPRETAFYNVPGSISGLAVTEVTRADPDSVKKAGVAAPFSLGRKMYFLATFSDGRRILAVTDPRTLARLERDIADGPVSEDSIAATQRANTRTGVIFLVTFAASSLVLEQYLAGYLPFLAAFLVAAAVGVAVRMLFPGE